MNESYAVDGLLSAASFAAHRHRKQTRKGEDKTPYINHLLAVAKVLASNGVDDLITLQAALLHDTIEDTETRPAELDSAFGAKVRSVVLEVTDDKQLDKAERKRLQIAKSAQLSDRAKIVKLGDLIDNTTDVAFNPPVDWPLERRRKYVAWTEKVVRGCRGVHERLEEHYDTALGEAWRELGVSDQ